MLAPPVVEGEGLGQPSEPQPAPSTTQPRIEEQIYVTESSSPQNTQSPRQALQEDTQLPQTSVPIPNVADEAIFKEWDDRVVRATTTAASLDAAQASGNISKTQSTTRSERASKHSYDSPLLGGNTPGSDDERIKQDDLTDFIPPTPHDSPLSGGHTPRSDEVIRKLKKKVKRLEKKQRARTPGMKLFKIRTSKRKSLDKEYVSKQGRKSDKTKPMFDDSDFDELDVDNAKECWMLMQKLRRNTAKHILSVWEYSIILLVIEFEREQRIARERVAEQEAKDAALIEQMEDIQARMDADELLAERLQQEEREQFTIEEKSRMLVEMIAERKRFFAAQRAEQIRNKPPTRAQLRNKMVTYLKHMGKYTHNQMKSKSFEEIQKLYEREQKWINDFVPMDSKVVKDSRKGKAEGSRNDNHLVCGFPVRRLGSTKSLSANASKSNK
ncbi:hypothetical protein Tco_1077090 [Tanacetum coccineum]